MSDVLDLVLAAHGELERWREVRYLDVRLSASGGLFQIKGHPEGLHDVIMRIEITACQSPLFPLGVPIIVATSPPHAGRSKIARVVSSRNVSTLVRRSPAEPSRRPHNRQLTSLLHGLRQLELLHRSVFAHTVWCRRPRDGAT